jgi:organic hydroperoxide reductase OsmC/OhrA
MGPHYRAHPRGYRAGKPYGRRWTWPTWKARTERPDSKTCPEELIAAAHAACHAMAFSHALAGGNVEIGLAVTLET